MYKRQITDWADGDILSATKLNQVVDNLEHLWALVQSVNPPREVHSLTDSDGSGTGIDFTIVHKHNNLYYYLPISQGTVEDIEIKYDTTMLFTTGTDQSNPYVFTGTIDLSALGFTIGQQYGLHIGFSSDGGVATLEISKIYEHP